MFNGIFAVIYTSILIFVAIEIKGINGMIDVVYEPLGSLQERSAEGLMIPIGLFLKKLILVDVIVMISINLVLLGTSIFIGFSWLFLIPISISLIMGAMIIIIGFASYKLIKKVILFLFRFVFKKIDERFGVSEKLKRASNDNEYEDMD